MKLVKSLALASAAAFVSLSGAQAADLPGAEPVEYVKVCDAYGDGFFYIPGSNTCLQIGGFARLDYSIGQVSGTRNAAGLTTAFKPANNNGFRARARVWFDARTDSEYGVVRTYIRAQFQRQSGGNQRGIGINGTSGSGLAQTDVNGDDSVFDKAFVQFAGLTAGLQDSFWDFKPYPTFTNPFISDRTLAVLGYTAEFGGGFSASIAIEDGTARRSTFSNTSVAAAVAGDPRYGEQKFPDIVGNLRVQGGWGEAQISGFAHNITNEQGGAGAVSRDTAWGYGGQIGAKIKLDGIAKGDFIWGTAAYANGALSYLGIGSGSSDFAFGIAGTQNINSSNRNFDFELDANGNIKKTKGYAFNIGALHYWDPKWRSAIGWTYARVNVDGGPVVNGNGNNDWRTWAATGNLIWSPVKKLDIGAEINYIKNTKTSAVYNLKDKDEWVGRLRVQKDF